ncbi:SIS domain-containing protein [Erysipelothrix inopinata]|uniref:SIS domain-containing protein n=1 Tax=Erysipelothrix inopinata TaxID=225084 RepID=A0A7G9S0M9_9FIRM|nr:SIS domain-containing protein [Erysipelothrix inopinata]QNN61404.1 SIS domain-containing protein [Erysipelothrix inopinata]
MDQIDSYLDIVFDELNILKESIDKDALNNATSLILDSESKGGRVHVTGIGKPSYVAGYVASLLSSTGTRSYVLHGTEAVHGSSGQVAPGDVVIAISNSGETVELKGTVETLLNNGAKIIAVTRSESSWLAQHANVTLKAGVNQEGDNLNKPPRASILAEMIVLQVLSVLLQNERQLNSQEYLKWHPGGALGASIRNEEK